MTNKIVKKENTSTNGNAISIAKSMIKPDEKPQKVSTRVIVETDKSTHTVHEVVYSNGKSATFKNTKNKN